MGVSSQQRETEELATQQSTQIKNLLNQYNDIVSFYHSMYLYSYMVAQCTHYCVHPGHINQGVMVH